MSNFSIGIDLGGTKILGGVINTKTGEVISSAKKRTKKDLGSDSIVNKVNEIINKIVSKSGIPLKDITSIGIGAAGQVNRKEGILISAPNLDCFNIEFKKIIESQFGKPLILGNDVEVATIGEKTFGAGREFHNFVCIFVGTGIGSGIIHNGVIYHGATGTAGEIGHILVQHNGRLCGCGNHGCLEAYASRTAVTKKIAASIKKGHPSILKDFYINENEFNIRSKHLKEALDQGDELTTNSIIEAADYFSMGLSSIINFYNPEAIILGGGLVEAVDFFFDMVQKTVKSKCLPVPSNSLILKKAELGDFSGIIGAAVMAKERISL